MEKQIEEMAQDMYRLLPDSYDINERDCENASKEMFAIGYRKQSEGAWKKVSEKYPRYVCTACNHLYNNKAYKYCPNCGAKMKGADDEKSV